MRRWHQDFNISKRQWKLHRRMHVESNKNSQRYAKKRPDGTYEVGIKLDVSAYEVDCECDEQIGRFRKKDANDCGIPGCFVCHSDKFPKRELTEQEKVSEISFREQLKELDSDE